MDFARTRSSVVGSEVEVHYEGGACEERAWAVVDESDERVVLTVMVSDSRGMCTAQAIDRTISTTLAQPLGDRQLVDGAAD